MTDDVVIFGFAVDVNLDLESDERPECIVHPDREAVMEGVLEAIPCHCPQTLCLSCYDRNKDTWQPGDPCWCYRCEKTVFNGGVFVRWEKL